MDCRGRAAFYDDGVFWLHKMPFKLKNAGAMSQRLVDTIFEGKMGRNLEAYVDDMVMKRKKELDMINDIEETLLTLKKSKHEAKSKEMLLQNGREKVLGICAEEAFQTMTKIIVELPTLTAPIKDEEPMVYLSAVYEAIRSRSHIDRFGGGRILLRPPTELRQLKQRCGIRGTVGRSKDSSQDKGRKDSRIRKFKAGSKSDHIPREENKKADALSKLEAVQFEGLTKWVFVDELNEQSVDMTEVNAIVEEATRTWMTPIQEYIERGILSKDATEARTIREKAHNYIMEDGILYRKSYLGPLLRCIGPQQAKYIIKEIHMGSCGMHDGPRKAVHKAMNAGYYWPNMHRDANNETTSCDSC
ncbi:reverse transcriptase domain-containing protein [Tanacetum coccineum]